MKFLVAIQRDTRERLARTGVETPELDARLIVEHVTGLSQSDLIVRPDIQIDDATAAVVEAAVKRRISGEPVHRIFGHREFYGLDLLLSPETLEPRPDTETLVEAMLPFVRAVAARKGECRILDLGTGTGAIALALLRSVEAAVAEGVDISEGALDTAARNAERLGLADRFTAVRSDWFSNIFGRYDAIVSNPPYIPTNDIIHLQTSVRDFDPRRALDGGEDGLDAYRLISDGAHRCLAAGGTIGVEIGYDQKDAVTGIFQGAGYRLTKAVRDLAGNDRVLMFQESRPEDA
ncbi:peptide chain release factor N(5)-glutamine methyltransferase [Mesorhizobium sp. AaZ16]|uniref:peptide chain release factor N(5)-glutamine methyltransferase n=1 Tax=Mesorhizobium sp. AaZ16 TaxID=3402289 RepID=UPI00374E3D6E